jgi:hypothetical protein
MKRKRAKEYHQCRWTGHDPARHTEPNKAWERQGLRLSGGLTLPLGRVFFIVVMSILMDPRASVGIIFRTMNMPSPSTPPGMPVGQRRARAVVSVVMTVHIARKVAVRMRFMHVVEMWLRIRGPIVVHEERKTDPGHQ